MSPHGRALQHCSPSAADSKEQGWFPCSHPTRLVHPHTPPEPALLFCPSKVLGPLSELLQFVRARASSSILMSLRLTLLPAAGGKSWVWEGRFPHPCHHMTYPRGGRGPFLAFISTGWISWAPPANRVCSSVHPRQGEGPLSLVLQLLRGRASSSYCCSQWGVGPILCISIFSGVSGSRSHWLW